MHPQTIEEIVEEISASLVGRSVGSILQLGALALAIDFRSRDKDYLLLSADPSLPRVHLISRPQRQLEKKSIPLSAFGQAVRSNLAGSKLMSAKKDEHERIVRFNFQREEETGELQRRVLLAQLTGRSANLLLLDDRGHVLQALRSLKGEGQQIGEEYAPPASHPDERPEPTLQKGSLSSLSAAADAFYQGIETARAFDVQAATARAQLRQQIRRLKKLQKHLQNDLALQGDPEEHKRFGDLLLANIATGERHGDRVRLTDFYAEGAPIVEIEIDPHISLQDEAARYFARYTKAKRGKQQIVARLKDSEEQLAELERKQLVLEEIIVARDEAALATFNQQESREKKSLAPAKNQQEAEKIPGTRRYTSSDGYEILVGRAAQDNDYLTFRVARSHEFWLHAADYPGSHVIIQNPNRREVPQRTLIEAAQLAAKFSHAKNDSKVNVHYTQRKFVSRIKGAAPGLVRLSTFKTMTVQPAEVLERI